MTDYQKYQLQWMLDHNYSLEDLINRLQEIQENINLNPSNESQLQTIKYIFSEFENTGFTGAALWACEDEWKNNDKLVSDNGLTEQEIFEKVRLQYIKEDILEKIQEAKDEDEDNCMMSYPKIYKETESNNKDKMLNRIAAVFEDRIGNNDLFWDCYWSAMEGALREVEEKLL